MIKGTDMEIREIRERLNKIDADMAELFVRRMETVKDLAEYRGQRGLSVDDREEELNDITAKSSLISDDGIRSLYISFLESTMEISKNWQRILMNGLRIACTDWKEGAGLRAGRAVIPNGCAIEYPGCTAAFQAVCDGECDVAVLPLENSFSGEVGKVYDLIFTGELFVNDVCAVEDESSITRYAVLSRVERQYEKSRDKEALLIMFTVRDEIGGLAKAINIISAYDYNMRVMRSRPMRDLPWHYYFYAELEGDCSPEKRERIVRALQSACPVVKVTGHFTADRIISAGEKEI